jgi:hypothetical protein
MIENRVHLTIKKGERVYSLNIGVDSPLGEIYDVLSEMRGDIFNRIKQVEEDQKKAEA